MKKNPVILLLLLLGLYSNAYAQQAYKGQLSITDKHLSVLSGELQVGMNVNYERLKLPSDESVTLIPILKSGDRSLELPSIVVNGTLKQKVYHRSEVLASKNKVKSTGNVAGVVVQNGRKKVKQVSYKSSVPYEEWMKDASLILRTRECGCNGKSAGMFEDKIADGITLPQARISTGRDGIDSRYLGLVNVVPLIDGEDTLHTLKGSISFWGNSGLEQLSNEKQNYEILFRLRETARSLEKQSGVTLSKLKVIGYGAPVGNYRKNEKNASMRALALKDYLRENYVVGKTPFDVSWVAEDWDSIRTLVDHSDMPLRQAVTDIINTVDLTKGRERMLINLGDGSPYRYMVGRIFPRVRRVDYAISYTQHRLDTAEGRRLFEMGSRSLKLSEFFSVAMSYPKGSNEYNDAFDLAARLFPDSPEAAINAASVALSKRDVKKARAYLEKYATLPLAYNNMGILYLLEGNRDKAEVYLQMAAAAGVKEAGESLSYLRQQHE
ncbi:DUF3868 domain-containing protein [Bacteroidaceae bacterium HV4-6-C5C]|nr:DUF3868 domain-containing protein [Bacteroidaceae bacterium HV4-6-C5C]